MPDKRKDFLIRPVEDRDLEDLVALEEASFAGDRLSRRRFQHWIKASNRVFLVVEKDHKVLAYGLVLLHKGTRLARLYSIAVSGKARGQGIGKALLLALERAAAEKGRFAMRLEVAKDNAGAIKLYEGLGYRSFGEYVDYYTDHGDALRMQKRIRRLDPKQLIHPVPWFQQSTEFTCGPASLLMAMASLDNKIKPNQGLEMDIWREATTIFMTSGHGGTHPLGLALAAKKRGFDVSAYISTDKPLFLDGVRTLKKKEIMRTVEKQFRDRAKKERVKVIIADVTQKQIADALKRQHAVMMLISTYLMDGKKAPHWVAVTGVDEDCIYVHDPDVDEKTQDALDCQHIPIAREHFAKMSTFGNDRLRTAIILKKPSEGKNKC
ncbi:MAG TPA: GNAT family N-acetyltransferase/peptidase C39 family protein [Xanthomonadales bacterium]